MYANLRFFFHRSVFSRGKGQCSLIPYYMYIYSTYIEDLRKHVGPNLVFADDDQQRGRPGRLAKHPAFGLVLLPAGYLTPSVDFVTFFVTDGQTGRRTDGRTDELKVFWAFYSILKN